MIGREEPLLSFPPLFFSHRPPFTLQPSHPSSSFAFKSSSTITSKAKKGCETLQASLSSSSLPIFHFSLPTSNSQSHCSNLEPLLLRPHSLILKLTSYSISTSPIGPIHFSHPSQSPSFVLPLPSSSRLRSIFRPSSSSKSTQVKKDQKQAKIEVEWIETEKNTFAPSKPSSPPPPYRRAIGEDLYCEDVEVKMSEKERKKQEKLERKRRELIEADERISEALKGFRI